MRKADWKEFRLGDIATILSGGDAPRGHISKFKTREYCIPIYSNGISAKGLYGYTDKASVFEPATTISARGTIGVVYKRTEPYLPIVRLISVIGDRNIVEPDFLYYYLCGTKISGDGSVQAQLTVPMISEYIVWIPDVAVQKKIAQILSCLDAKIELNTQINQNLEAQAQAIFKSWFVDFEPFKNGKFIYSELGPIPEGWRVLPLDEIATFLNGLPMQKYRPSEDNVGLPILKIKELREQCCSTDSERCTEHISPEYIVDDGDVIFSWSGSLMVDIWTGGKCGLNQHLFKVTSAQYEKWFYYLWIQYHMREFIAIAADKATTMGHIQRGHLHTALALVPPKQEYSKLSAILTPIIERLIQSKFESRHLATLRDALLPKLMSGEIDMSEIEV